MFEFPKPAVPDVPKPVDCGAAEAPGAVGAEELAPKRPLFALELPKRPVPPEDAPNIECEEKVLMWC